MRIFLLSFALVLSLFLSGCGGRYAESDFLGKTSAQVVAEYGDFDCVTVPAGEDGLYRNCRCGYTVREARSGSFGRTEEVLFFIQFDENGQAVDCEEGPRPGG